MIVTGEIGVRRKEEEIHNNVALRLRRKVVVKSCFLSVLNRVFHIIRSQRASFMHNLNFFVWFWSFLHGGGLFFFFFFYLLYCVTIYNVFIYVFVCWSLFFFFYLEKLSFKSPTFQFGWRKSRNFALDHLTHQLSLI